MREWTGKIMSEENVSFEELLNNSLNNNKKLGKYVDGKVISISSKDEIYVDLDYKADGIVPKSEFSFNENDDPHNFFKPGDPITCEVLKMNDGEGNVLLSYKRGKNKFERKKFWDSAEVGKEYEGTVSSVCSYGAFVDIDGVQGLLHISEISWEKNANANDYLKQGQKIKVRIKALDKENKRIQFSYDGKGENPWNEMNYKVGDVVTVKVKKIMPYGAFVEVQKGIDGLVHISQICNKKIAKPDDVLKIGEKVNAKIIDLDKENGKLELSIRELEGTSDEYNDLEGEEVENGK